MKTPVNSCACGLSYLKALTLQFNQTFPLEESLLKKSCVPDDDDDDDELLLWYG